VCRPMRHVGAEGVHETNVVYPGVFVR